MPSPGLQLFDGVATGVERVLDFRLVQHELIAGNLANSDTPGYLARELPFQDMLGEVMRQASAGEEMHDVSEVEMVETEASPLQRDGNSVDAEHEAVKLTENLVWYNALTSGLSKHLALLRFAASDGRA